MRTLSNTITRLSRLRAQYKSQGGGGAGDGRLSELRDFGSNPGALGAKVYVPRDLPEGAPLVVVLHGCTQTATSYDRGAGWSTLADQEGFALLFPEQQRANNPNLCFNWFVPGDIKRNGGEALSIKQMVETSVRSHKLDRTRIFITGLSAGGAMTSVMLATYPEVFAGGAIIAGLPYGTANSIPQAFDRMRGHGIPSTQQLQRRLREASSHDGPWPTLSVWHGSADQTVDSSNAKAIIEQWCSIHGVAAAEVRRATVNGHSRKVWCNAHGREVMEAYSISGMGHGTPIATTGRTGLGTAGPFMLEAGICSTRCIAQFWGLLKAPADAMNSQHIAARMPAKVALAPALSDLEGQMKSGAGRSPSTEPATGIQKTIEDALRSAGLMR